MPLNRGTIIVVGAGIFGVTAALELVRRGWRVTPVDPRNRSPAWRAQHYADGFYHARGGYAESGRVVEKLAEACRHQGVDWRLGVRFGGLLEEGSRVGGIRSTSGERLPADRVLVAAGAWTPNILPHLAGSFRITGHPIFHFRPPNTRLTESGPSRCSRRTSPAPGWTAFPLIRAGAGRS